MDEIHPQYITDANGKTISVIIPVAEYERIIEELEDLNDIRLFDEATAEPKNSISLDDYVNQRFGK